MAGNRAAGEGETVPVMEEPTEKPRSWRRPVTLIGAAAALSILGDQALYVILPAQYVELGLIPFQVGLVLSLNRAIRLITNHFAEGLVRRKNPRLLLISALLLGAALTIFYACQPIFALLLVARALWGLCWSVIRQAGTMTAIDAAKASQRGLAIGMFNGVTRLGSVVGMLFAGLMYDRIGYAWMMVVLGGASFLAVFPGWASGPGLHVHHSSFLRPNRRKASLSLLICGFLVGCVGPGVIAPTLGYVLKTHVGVELTIGSFAIGVTTLTGLMLALRHTINTLGAPTLGLLLDRIGHRRGLVIFFCAATFFLLLAALTAELLGLFVLVMAFFICQTSLHVALSSEAGKAGSGVFASYSVAGDLGMAIGPLLAWTTLQYISSTSVLFSIGAGLCGLGAVFAMMRRPQSRGE